MVLLHSAEHSIPVHPALDLLALDLKEQPHAC